MIRTTIKSFIQADLESVWHSVTSLYDYSWRSDIKDIEVSDERHFREIVMKAMSPVLLLLL